MASVEKLKLFREHPTKYHFKTKDDNRVEIEHKDARILVNLFKWGTECSLQVDLAPVYSNRHNFSETDNKIETENADALMRVYPIDTRSTGEFYGDSDDDVQCHDGGLRFELVLKKKRPARSNVFEFPVVSRNLRFSYQPFLTPEDEGMVRPLNVEGSYSVYHVSKKNNQYMTGKAFHIFRPIAEDALGNKAWCAINFDKYIDPTILTITVPQQFLDEATYPITIDPDFGYTAIGASSDIIALQGPAFRSGSAWIMPAPGGTANYMRARVFGGVGDTDDCKVFINQKDSGGVGTHAQIATDENLNCAEAEHWEEFTLAGETLTSGVVYILSIMGKDDFPVKGDSYNLRVDTNGAVASYYEENTYAAPENPWVAAAEGTTEDKSIYVNYTDLPGWAGKIAGVTNPAEIAGVAVANIAEVKSVA